MSVWSNQRLRSCLSRAVDFGRVCGVHRSVIVPCDSRKSALPVCGTIADASVRGRLRQARARRPQPPSLPHLHTHNTIKQIKSSSLTYVTNLGGKSEKFPGDESVH
ncbi:hypothetical protein MTP99_000614 [Tenebrio molitor]|nr:hypothetical protein MTP99_000614 [Tenebrio molitor]